MLLDSDYKPIYSSNTTNAYIVDSLAVIGDIKTQWIVIAQDYWGYKPQTVNDMKTSLSRSRKRTKSKKRREIFAAINKIGEETISEKDGRVIAVKDIPAYQAWYKLYKTED